MTELLKVQASTEALKTADKIVETVFAVAAQKIRDEVGFDFKCSKCDEIHEGALNHTVVAALFKANINYYITQNFDEDHHEIIGLYAAVFTSLFNNKTANAEIISEELESRLRKQFHKDVTDAIRRDNLPVPEDAVAGILMLQIEKWNDA